MRARVIRIGNSQGLRIPKPFLEQTGITDDVEIEIEKNQLIIRPVKNARREGWDKAFGMMVEKGDTNPLSMKKAFHIHGMRKHGSGSETL
jgi:antitoxin MazE